jgi:hypothetical protein
VSENGNIKSIMIVVREKGRKGERHADLGQPAQLQTGVKK